MRPRLTTKTNYKARVNGQLNKNGICVLTIIELTHNYSHVSLEKSRLYRSYKYLDEYNKNMLDLNDRANI